ncbi:hypothetical protein GQ43DRAFT_439041 [Delitschia confertaspora ATCC 74209]|uniref:Secreted protein n=1 Tax=Delitschia confertaspora ATCC 74209 TaxID=1513339 RepID=A0A9P4JPJ9_9PLEO|nr:hypothetical protein GQ43DRAFT_439041 [Delitschia confertaspora ATCC 74209]
MIAFASGIAFRIFSKTLIRCFLLCVLHFFHAHLHLCRKACSCSPAHLRSSAIEARLQRAYLLLDVKKYFILVLNMVCLYVPYQGCMCHYPQLACSIHYVGQDQG